MPTNKDLEKNGILSDNQRRFVSLVGRLCDLVDNNGDRVLFDSLSNEVLVLGLYEIGTKRMEISVLFDYSQFLPSLGNDLVMLYLKEYACAVTGDYLNAAEYKRIQDELRGKHEQISKLISVLRYAMENQAKEQSP